MKTWMIIAGGLFAMFCVFVVAVAIWVMGIFNGEVQLHNRYDQQKNDVELSMDNMRKVLINSYKVNSEFAETFVKVATAVSSGRSGGSLFKMVTESSGNVIQGFTPELASKMMNSIEGKMSEFKRSQQVMIDVYRQHKSYCQIMPNSILIGNKILPEPLIISSDVSKEAMKTGKLNDDVLGAKTQGEKP